MEPHAIALEADVPSELRFVTLVYGEGDFINWGQAERLTVEAVRQALADHERGK